VAQPGSALAWGARGPEFKSRRSDQYLQTSIISKLMDTFMDTPWWCNETLRSAASWREPVHFNRTMTPR
jgi:hypothetical protein